MSRFFSLVYNELIKTYIRKSTWVMYALLAVIIIGGAFISNIDSDENAYSSDDWRQELEDENESLMEEQEDFDEDMEDMDVEDTDIYSEDMAKNNYYLEHDIKPASYDAWAFTNGNAGMLSIVSLLTIIIAAGIIAHEFRWGTIKLLLIRPISRSVILLSKYVAVLLFALFTLLFVLFVSLIVGSIFFGFNGFDPHIVVSHGEGFAYVSQIGEILSGYGYKLVNLIMMTTFAFMISAVFRNSTMAVGTAIFLMLTGNTIVTIFQDHDWAKYILFANTDLTQYVHSGAPLVESMTLGFSITVLIVYYAVFMVLSWIFFTKRDVAGQ